MCDSVLNAFSLSRCQISPPNSGGSSPRDLEPLKGHQQVIRSVSLRSTQLGYIRRLSSAHLRTRSFSSRPPSSRSLAKFLRSSQSMNTEQPEALSAVSPPTSPPAKRVKVDTAQEERTSKKKRSDVIRYLESNRIRQCSLLV
ncbi:hypothetical protein PoMZ_11668 [Pyricularia oryzae]|uniref:Uncharacterized protein n=1 Tax=Pyricularia oryzae TaxID=318829 RepID=A0A4P7NKX9_PYROR|nr:hypothetical protein PoMZ_11668 [Pyricularia oryzae]